MTRLTLSQLRAQIHNERHILTPNVIDLQNWPNRINSYVDDGSVDCPPGITVGDRDIGITKFAFTKYGNPQCIWHLSQGEYGDFIQDSPYYNIAYFVACVRGSSWQSIYWFDNPAMTRWYAGPNYGKISNYYFDPFEPTGYIVQTTIQPVHFKNPEANFFSGATVPTTVSFGHLYIFPEG